MSLILTKEKILKKKKQRINQNSNMYHFFLHNMKYNLAIDLHQEQNHHFGRENNQNLRAMFHPDHNLNH